MIMIRSWGIYLYGRSSQAFWLGKSYARTWEETTTDTAQVDSATTNRANATLVLIVASQLLKSRHQWLGLVQQAVSIMLYGNSSSKQVRKLAVCKWAFTDALYYILITGVHESATSPSVHALQTHLESCWKDKWAPWCGSTILERWNEKELVCSSFML